MAQGQQPLSSTSRDIVGAPRQNYIYDSADVLSPTGEWIVDQYLRELDNATTVETVIFTLPRAVGHGIRAEDGDEIPFVTQLAQYVLHNLTLDGKRGVGDKEKDNGIVVLLSLEPDISTGPGMSGAIAVGSSLQDKISDATGIIILNAWLDPALAYYRETGNMSAPTPPAEEVEDANETAASNNDDDYRNNLTRFDLEAMTMANPSDLNNFQQRKQVNYEGSSTSYDRLVTVGTGKNSSNNNISNEGVSSSYITVFDSAFLNIVILLGEQVGYISDNPGLKPPEAPGLKLPGAPEEDKQQPGGDEQPPGGGGGWAEVIVSLVTIVFFTGYIAYDRYKKIKRRLKK
ncbi:MAG: TPM domain-containing protein [Thermoproteota archaeon]|nr:TPM domain-containing protein [Thermoproteota archaeon]